MTPSLKQAYIDLQQWIDDGCPENGRFEKYYGICDNFKNSPSWGIIKGELADQFESAGLSCIYPWGRDDFLVRINEETMYECPKRLAWIKEHAQ